MESTRPTRDRDPIRRAVVTVTIGCFSLAALLGVVALLGGGDFGETEVRVLLTTLLVGVVSMAVLCYLATAGTPFEVAGAIGGLVVLVPLGTGLLLAWGGAGAGQGVVEAFGVGAVVATTLAQVCLLLVLAQRAAPVVRVLLALTLVVAGLLAAILCGLVLGLDGDDALWRVVGVVAILDVLGTVVVAALGGLGGRSGAPVPGVERVALPAALVAELDRRAAREGRTRHQAAAEAVEQYLRAPAP